MDRFIEFNGVKMPITAKQIGNEHIILVDGVEWVRTTNLIHAATLFNMMCDHLGEYMFYQEK